MEQIVNLKYNRCMIDELDYRIAVLTNDTLKSNKNLKETISTDIDLDYKIRKDFKKILIIGKVNVKTQLLKVEFRQMAFRFHFSYNINMDKNLLKELNSENIDEDTKRFVINKILGTCKAKYSDMIVEHIRYTIANIAKALGLTMNIQGQKHEENIVLKIDL